MLLVSMALLLAVALLGTAGPAAARTPAFATAHDRPGVVTVRDLDRVTPDGFPPAQAGYHSYAEMAAEVLQAENAHPGLVKRFSIGTSYQGREIWAARVTANVSLPHDGRPAVLLDSLHHAREHLTVEMTLSILHLLADNYADQTPLGERVRDILRGTVVYLVFMVDPDGGEYDISGTASHCVSGFRCWRKNRQPNAGSSYVGTDLNRNYGYKWGCCGGSSGSTSSDTYRGPSAFSAPESKRVRDFVDGRRVNYSNQIRAHITFHAAGEQVLWPYGYTYADVPSDMTTDDHAAFVALGNAMADRNDYTPKQSSSLYITDGDQIDWLYALHRVFSFTFEMYPRNDSSWGRFYPPDDVIERETERNHDAVLYLLEHAACPHSVLGGSRAVAHCGPFSDDFEISRGVTTDPAGTDTATGGRWERGQVEKTTYQGGTKQPAGAASGRMALVTGKAAGSGPYANDLDGRTTAVTRSFKLTGGRTYRVAFKGYLAHDTHATSADHLRISLLPASGSAMTIYQLNGRAGSVDAAWTARSKTFTAPATGTYRLRMEAVDGGSSTLLEAGIDDLYVAAE